MPHKKNRSVSSYKAEALRVGARLIDQKRYADACTHYNTACTIIKADPQLVFCLAVAFHLSKEYLIAIYYYCEAISLNKYYLEAFENLSEAQSELGLFSDALISIRSAIKINNSKSINFTRCAKILNYLGLHKESIEASTLAIELAPDSAIAYMIRSQAYRSQNMLDESIEDLKISIKLDSENPEHAYNMAFDLLLRGDFLDGWELYEKRFLTRNFIDNSGIMISPRWNGSDNLNGKTILVCAEQGLGDQIQFCRYSIKLKELGAKVILAVTPTLVELVKSIHSDILVVSTEQSATSIAQHDYYIPLMSLLRIFKVSLENIYCPFRYLHPTPSAQEKWGRKIKKNGMLKIGVDWSGNQKHTNDRNRSINFNEFNSLFKINAEWHILQTDFKNDEISLIANSNLIDFTNELVDFNETAGLIDQLDLVISVDTSVAHLASALGKATWILLPLAPDFRWLLKRNDSPWYKNIRLFRQTKSGIWSDVIQEISYELRQFVNINI